ncbi:MAG: hypothetical protein H0W31_11330 [Actinobacteria bacterium]|nr:hypothetical protein [Actinomycetota bacterium]
MPVETVTELTPTQFREELEGLLRLATEYAALESRIESKAREIELVDWVGDMRFADGVAAQVRAALNDATNKDEQGIAEFGALDLCQSIQDALDVLKFAMERDDRAN